MSGPLNTRIARDQRGAALVEAALIVPLVLLIMVGIFEVGRAYQTFQVLTNAAREGARASVVPGADVDTVKATVNKYINDGQLRPKTPPIVDVDRTATMQVNGLTVGASLVTIDYSFDFMMLQPVARLVVANSDSGSAITMRASSLMRNEAQ